MLRSHPDYYLKLKTDAAQKNMAASTKSGQIGINSLFSQVSNRRKGKKGTQRFLTMARADLSAYNYLVSQYEARQWIENSIGEKLDEDFWVAVAGTYDIFIQIKLKTEPHSAA
jgi:hypothetical protein